MRLVGSGCIKNPFPKLKTLIHLHHMVTSSPWLRFFSRGRPIRVAITPKQWGTTANIRLAEQIRFSIGTRRHRDWRYYSPSWQMRTLPLLVTCLAGKRMQNGTLIASLTGMGLLEIPRVRDSTSDPTFLVD